MTRINLIDPIDLTDQHLIAEYREIRLLTSNTRRSFEMTGERREKIPKQFTLNAGHCLFFKDKGQYISDRYQQLLEEMQDRGFEPTHTEIDHSAWRPGFFNAWQPSARDRNIVRERIILRINQRPGWYRYRGKPIPDNFLRIRYAYEPD